MTLSESCRKNFENESSYIFKYMFCKSLRARHSFSNSHKKSYISNGIYSLLLSRNLDVVDFAQRNYTQQRATKNNMKLSESCRITADSLSASNTPNECDSSNIISINFINENIYKPNTTLGGKLMGKVKCNLTERQIQVAELLGKALSNKEIGEKLGVVEKTIKSHVTEIYRAMGVSSRPAFLLKYHSIVCEEKGLAIGDENDLPPAA